MFLFLLTFEDYHEYPSLQIDFWESDSEMLLLKNLKSLQDALGELHKVPFVNEQRNLYFSYELLLTFSKDNPHIPELRLPFLPVFQELKYFQLRYQMFFQFMPNRLFP